jgi:hypothetical protein
VSTVLPFRRPALKVGDKVAYSGPELTVISLWSGHPGTVALVELDPLAGYSVPWVEFHRGPILDLDPRDLTRLDTVTFYRRLRRLEKGQHPLEDRDVLAYQASSPPDRL